MKVLARIANDVLLSFASSGVTVKFAFFKNMGVGIMTTKSTGTSDLELMMQFIEWTGIKAEIDSVTDHYLSEPEDEMYDSDVYIGVLPEVLQKLRHLITVYSQKTSRVRLDSNHNPVQLILAKINQLSSIFEESLYLCFPDLSYGHAYFCTKGWKISCNRDSKAEGVLVKKSTSCQPEPFIVEFTVVPQSNPTIH